MARRPGMILLLLILFASLLPWQKVSAGGPGYLVFPGLALPGRPGYLGFSAATPPGGLRYPGFPAQLATAPAGNPGIFPQASRDEEEPPAESPAAHQQVLQDENEGEDPPATSPRLTLVNDSMPTCRAGGYLYIPLNIKNTGNAPAKNIIITPELDPESPFMPDSLNQTKTIGIIAPDQMEKANLRFDVSAGASERVYAIKLTLCYYDEAGGFYTNEDGVFPNYLYVRVINDETPPRLSIDNLELSAAAVQPGKGLEIELSIGNHGTLEARELRVSLGGLKEEGFSLSKGTNLRNLGALGGDATTAVAYTITPSPKMESGRHALFATIEYKDRSGREYSLEEQFFIPVENGSTGKTTPKIILSRYSCNPTIVKAGQNFTLSLQVLNTSKEKAVRNIKVFLTVPEGGASGNVFTPINTSNTFYIERIPPKGTSDKSLSFFTIPDAAPKTYTLTANFEYEDDQGNEYTASDIIGVPVSQQIRLDTSEIDLPPEVYQGQPLPLGLELYNTGKVELMNMMVTLEGEFEVQNGKYFIGNFEVGASDYFEAMIIPGAPGEIQGAVVLSYDDPSGGHEEIRKEFTLNIMGMPEPDPGGMDPEIPEQVGPSTWKKLAWITGPVLAAGAGSLVFFRIRKRKREDLTLDE